MSWGAEDLSVTIGTTRALRSVTLECPPGLIVAVVGGDGAGKTTLLRSLANILAPTNGSVSVPGAGRVGYVPPTGGIFPDLTVDEHIDFVSSAYGLADWRPRAAELLARTELAEFGSRLAGNLSGGQRRKLGAALALLPQPKLLVLDEVTTGVDPVSRMGLWRMIARAAAEGAAVVFATSYLDEAERAGWVAILHEGMVLAQGPPASIIAATPGSVIDTTDPQFSDRAWRRGRMWREWDPSRSRMATDEITLEDAAIVAELQSAEVGS